MITKSKSYYLGLFKEMIEEDKDRDNDFLQYDKMYHFDWQLPSGYERLEWIGKYVSPVAHDTVNVTVKTLGINEPHIHYFPLLPNEATREWANQVEEVLKWNLYLASKRKRGNMIADIVRNACMYDMAAIQVIDIDHQIASIKKAGGDSKRFEAMRRYSRFLLNVYNPSLVHFRYSNIMLESVLLAQVKSAFEIYKEFGQAAEKLRQDAESDEEQTQYKLYDYIDDTNRVVIACPYHGGVADSEKDAVLIVPPQEHQLKFIPWAISCGGSDSELEYRDRFHGILYPLLRGQLWEFLNRAESLIHSRAVADAGRPDIAEIGNVPLSSRQTIIDRDDPFGILQVTPGDTITGMPTGSTIPAMQEEEARLRTDITATTGTQSLQLIGVPEGTAYATLSLLLQNAAGNIELYKTTAERAIEDMLRLMLLWSHYRDVPLEGLGKNWKNKNNYGEQYIIDPREIDPYRIYIKVELRKNLPIDQLQRINTVTMAVQALGLSQEDGLEMCGIDDPIMTMNKRRFEILQENEIQLYIKSKNAELEAEIAQAQASAQMQLQALQGQQNAPGAMNYMISGQGFNPAQGGAPPAMANPNMTKEMQTGITRGGYEGEGVA